MATQSLGSATQVEAVISDVPVSRECKQLPHLSADREIREGEAGELGRDQGVGLNRHARSGTPESCSQACVKA